jgi:hypothetical protein
MPDFRFAVNQALAQVRRSGEVKRIYDRGFCTLGAHPPLRPLEMACATRSISKPVSAGLLRAGPYRSRLRG